MKTKILLLIACVFLTGCKIQKHSQIEAVSSSIEQRDVREEKTEINTLEKIEATQVVTDTKETTNESIIEVNLSAPDSTGKQYPTSIKYTNRGVEFEQKKAENSLIDECFNQVINAKKTDSTRKEDNSTIRQESETKTSAQTGWITAVLIVAIIIGAIALIIVGICFVRKFKK